jgi:hypothetical protein
MSAGECQTKNRKNYEDADDEKPIKALDEGALRLHSYSGLLSGTLYY